MKLDDYLELPEVKKLGITRKTAHANIVPSAIHLVANLSSASSPLCLVVAPNRQEMTTRQSINSALHSGFPNYLKFNKYCLNIDYHLASQ